ncbi:hypothetical protein ACLMJK_000920 [Lecanora helva]
MAKTPKPKTTKPSLKSRASRRATSPALENNLDNSLRSIPRPSSSSSKILAPHNHTHAGITKKNRGKKVLKRKQKVRLEQAREKAEAVGGKLERKVGRAEKMREGRRGRNTDWDDLNSSLPRQKPKSKKNTSNNLPEDDGLEDVFDDEGAMQVTTANTRPITTSNNFAIDEAEAGAGAKTEQEPPAAAMAPDIQTVGGSGIDDDIS